MNNNNQQNLFQIHEEFDLGDRVKKFKGKKIKIKRLVTKPNGDLTLRDESTFLNESNQSINNPQNVHQSTSSFNPLQDNIQRNFGKPKPNEPVEQFFNRANNKMFHSTYQNQNQKSFKNSQIVVQNNFHPRMSYNTKMNILTQIDQAPNQNQRKQMFVSQRVNQFNQNQSISVQNGKINFPKNVNDFLNQEMIIKAQTEQATNKECAQAFNKIDNIQKRMNEVFNQAKKRISFQYDDYLNEFNKNIGHFKHLCLQYKQKNQFKTNPQGEFDQLRLSCIEYYDKRNNLELKKELTQQEVDSSEIDHVLYKKLLSYVAENLKKRILHIPKFAVTENAQKFLKETEERMKNLTEKELETISNYLYKPDIIDIQHIGVRSQQETIGKVVKQTMARQPRVSQITIKQPRYSYIQKKFRNSVTSAVIVQEGFDMRKSMAHFNSIISSRQLLLNAQMVDKDFKFTSKEFNSGPFVKGKEHVGICSIEDFYILYGDEFYCQFYPGGGQVKPIEFKKKYLTYIATIKSKLSCLRVDNSSVLQKNLPVKNYILIGCLDKESLDSEILVCDFVEDKPVVYKRIKLETKSKILKILSLNDWFTFIAITEDGMIYLCDLSMSRAKETITKCLNQKILSSDILDNFEYFAISTGKLIHIFEVLYEKSYLNQYPPYAKKLDRVRIVSNTAEVNQIKGTGVLLFDGVDSQGDYASVDLGKGSIKNTKVHKVSIKKGQMDRFFIVNNPEIGKSLKKRVLIYLNFSGEVGIYNFETKIAHSFDIKSKIEQFSPSEQNMVANKFQEKGFGVFLVTKNGLHKLTFS